MSIPLDPNPPPGFVLQKNTNDAYSSHGSIGVVVAVLVVVIILGVAAVVIGKLCSGRSIMGYGHYDFESWAEAKCSSCIDGRINPQIIIPTQHSNPNISVSTATPNPTQTHQQSELNQPDL